MLKRMSFTLMIVALVAMVLPFEVSAQETTEVARMRIGYFAFDPMEVDTFIDGYLASFGMGWTTEPWNVATDPANPSVRGRTATPFMEIAAGSHSFAFVPKGDEREDAILGPEEVVFEAGHVYSLAVVGLVEDESLNLLVIDESDIFSDANLDNDWMMVAIHNIQGAPPVDIKVDGRVVYENLVYGQFGMFTLPGGFAQVEMVSKDDPNIMFYGGPVAPAAGVSDFGGFTGTYPGDPGTDYFMVYNWDYLAEPTIVDGGTVTVGEEIAGEIAELGQRNQYTLTVDSDIVLDIYANATGDRTSDSWLYGYIKFFDPFVSIYDAQGNLLFWNDEISFQDADGDQPLFDAGLKGIELVAGIYTVEVRGAAETNAGPYVLTVESAGDE